MKFNLYSLLFALIVVVCSCNNPNDDRIKNLEQRVQYLEYSNIVLKNNIEKTHQISFSDTTSISTFKWFRLGDAYFDIVNHYFEVAQVKSEYLNNGYQITGIVTNLLSLNMSQVKITGAIENNSKQQKVVTGSVELPNLMPGEKTIFTLFIPTSQTNVEKVGIKVEMGRM
jgi:hypothetical protein